MDVDLAIVGAGPAACAAARAAARHGIHAVLVAPHARTRPGLLELLAASAHPALAALQLADGLVESLQPLERTRFRWGREAAGERVTPPASASARIVDRADLDAALVAGALAAGAERVDARVVGWQREGSTWVVSTLTAADGAPGLIRAPRVLVGTGRGSRLVQRAGSVRHVRHHMVAIIQRLDTSQLQGTMMVEPTPHGWWYGMGTARGTTIGFVTDSDLLATGLDRAVATWNREREGIDWVAAPGELELRPAAVAQVEPPEATDLLPIGDAALAVDPLSGHGLRIAIESGIRGALDPTGYGEWLRTEQRRHADDERALYDRETRFAAEPFWSRRAG